ncbi:hypothetical protein [Caulobacter sp.]
MVVVLLTRSSRRSRRLIAGVLFDDFGA